MNVYKTLLRPVITYITDTTVIDRKHEEDLRMLPKKTKVEIKKVVD